MTKEELKKEARQKALEWNGEKINGKYNRPPIANWSCYEKGYLAGAEPREKRIAELIALINAERERQEKCDDVHLRKIAELEKENAELKKKCYKKAVKDYCKVEKQLTKAKELLRQLVNIEYAVNIPKDKIISLRVKAEQFLSEVEKK